MAEFFRASVALTVCLPNADLGIVIVPLIPPVAVELSFAGMVGITILSYFMVIGELAVKFVPEIFTGKLTNPFVELSKMVGIVPVNEDDAVFAAASVAEIVVAPGDGTLIEPLKLPVVLVFIIGGDVLTAIAPYFIVTVEFAAYPVPVTDIQ
jgi:hypothetical protein